jgi:hypothetical protein
LSFSFDPPERTQSEISKDEHKAAGSQEPARTFPAGRETGPLAGKGNAADSSHREENKASHFQPQLVQHSAEGSRRDSGGVADGVCHTSAPDLLRRNSGRNTQFPG